MFGLFDWTIVLILPALFFAMWAQFKVKSTYAKYARVGTRRRLTGADVASRILANAGISTMNDPEAYPGGAACAIEPVGGNLSDHYDPRSHTVRLSQDVYYGQSIASLGIAAHEVGHAIQHARSYAPLTMRNVIYPVASIGSNLAFVLFLIGLFTQFQPLLLGGIALFSAAVFFTVLTLPVEFNASRRAIAALADGGYLDADELSGAKKVLTAAAMTYLASTLMAVSQLVRMLIIADRD